MGKKARWSAIAVWALVIFSVLYTLPTFVGKDSLPEWYTGIFGKELNYGLDLQGGLELRYTVDWKKAIEDNGRKLGDSIRQQLVEEMAERDNKNVADLSDEELEAYRERIGTSIPDYDTIRVEFDSGDLAETMAEDVLADVDPRYEMAVVDDTTYDLKLLPEEVQTIRSEAVKKTRQLIAGRVEAFGLVDPDVRVAGESDIVVQIPGVGKDQMDMVRQRIGQTAQLTFRMVDDESEFFAEQESKLEAYKAENPERAASLELVPQSSTGPYLRAERKSAIIRFVRSLDVPDDHVVGYELVEVADGNIVSERYWRTQYLHGPVELSGKNLARAQVLYDEKGMPYASLDLDAEGGRIFADLTEKNVGEYMAIMLDETVESAPVINEKIPGGRVKITMGGNRGPQQVLAEARSLATVLNQGAYQAPVYKVHDHEVGASLGHDSVQAGKMSILVGSLVVIIFMMIYYKVSGVFAVTALVLNLLLILALLVSFNSALTLPGMAGIILTIGMAVDANIIIFERIREEVRSGRGPRPAVESGYAKAWSTILDANVTTALAGVILLNYTSGPIRGFAVTLLMGIVCSVFTAVYVCRRIFNWYLETRRPETLSI
ncbi:MAG: protein translocase subunit SecD [Myxococcota bacterium]